jgi:hypothetical protein
MARFTKHNNPSRKRRARRSPYSQAYIEDRRNEMNQLLAGAKTEAEREIIQKAFDVTIRP